LPLSIGAAAAAPSEVAANPFAGNAPVTRVDLPLDAAESAWLASHRQLTVGVVSNNLVPFDLTGLNNEYLGISAEYLGAITSLLGVALRVRNFDSIEQAEGALARGDVDLLPSIPTLRVRPGMKLTAPYVQGRLVQVLAPGRHLDVDADIKVGYVTGHVMPEALQRVFPHARLLPYRSSLSGLSAAASGSNDVFVDYGASVVYLIDRYEMMSLLPESFAEPAMYFHFAVREDNTVLGQLIERAVAALPAHVHTDIKARWTPTYDPGDVSSTVSLSKAENEWIATHREVHFAAVPDRTPFMFNDAAGRPSGLTMELLDRIADRTGLVFRAVNPGKAAADAIDIQPVVVRDTPPLAGMTVTRPYLRSHWVVVSRIGDADFIRIEDLAGKRIAYLPPNGVVEQIKARMPTTQLLPVASVAASYQLVASGGADAAIGATTTANYFIRAQYADRLRIAGDIVTAPVDIAFAVRSDAPELLTIIDKALESIGPDDMRRLRVKWLYLHEASIDWRRYYPWFIGVGCALLSGFALFVGWNRYLQKQIRVRQQFLEMVDTARAGAERASRAKSNFLATMSHEIRSPMHAVLGVLELLIPKTRLDEDDRTSIELAHSSAQSLLRLLDDILDISKIEAGGLEISSYAARLGAIVEGVAAVFNHLAHQRGLRITVSIDPAVAAWHHVDGQRFRQIVNNLVSNAIKYTDAGEVRVRLLHQAGDASAETVVLEVQDTGIGMAPEELKNLLVPFYQAERAGPRTEGGTGLGWPIVQRLCQLMGGDVAVDSAPGTGTCVRITLNLPLAAAPAEGESAAAIAHGGHWGRFNILVVDDHPANRFVLQRQLVHLGFRCALAENGETALNMWNEGDFDLVLTDCAMPVMDGYQLAAAIRATEQTRAAPRCPILGCTAHVQEERQHLALQVGMDECLIKPIGVDALLAALARHLVSADAGATPAAPLPDNAAAEAQAFDVSSLHTFSGGEGAIEKQFLEVLQQTNRSDLLALQGFIDNAALAEAAACCHRIKGAAQIIGAAQVGHDCTALEAAIVSNTGAADTDGLDRATDAVAVSLEQLDIAIAAQLASYR
jgi:two-component system sensor histidine kinase EvgS